MAWLDTTAIVVIMVIGLFLMYRVLKEPLDLLFSFFASIWSTIITALGSGASATREIITYE